MPLFITVLVVLLAFGRPVATQPATAQPVATQPATITVTGIVSLARGQDARVTGAKPDSSNAVVWLKPLSGGTARTGAHTRFLPRSRFTIVQKSKRFEPHVLAVPVGSVVDFPNLDPFFHNVFSMFDGKRFDLGLYEAGASHAVTFDKAGICYVFCNIHPEMSAAVVVVDSPYYATSDRAGAYAIPDVPPGRYLLFVWSERTASPLPDGYPREITVSSDRATLAPIRLVDAGQLLAPHMNKYGREYDPAKPYTPVRK